MIYSSQDSSIGTLEGFTNYAFNTNIEYAEMADRIQALGGHRDAHNL